MLPYLEMCSSLEVHVLDVDSFQCNTLESRYQIADLAGFTTMCHTR